jgi:4-hydroxy-tetrahydrodipicolinate reductase
MSYRVVQWGTGNVGSYALRAIHNHPELELVGLIVSNPDKAGKDASAFTDIPETGVRATTNPEEALALQPDCVCYTGASEHRLFDAAKDQMQILSRGINVVSSSLFMLQYPESDIPGFVENFEEACRSGQSTCFNNGIDPGFANDIMPLVFTALSEYWTSIRVQEIVNYSTYVQENTIREVMGFGYPIDHESMLFAKGALSMGWGGTIRSIAAGLGVKLDRIYEVTERLPLEADTRNAMGLFEKGTTGAMRFEVRGVVGDHEPIVLEHVTRLVDDIAPHWPQGKGYRAIIEGEPRMEITMNMEDRHGDHAVGGVIQTATRIVNAIPAVVEHAPGMISALDLPMITAKGLYRPEARAAS